MHELALMESLVETVEEGVEAARVLRVRLEVGRLTAAVHDALRFSFDVCARGTRLEGAALEIVDVPGRARCEGCGAERAIEMDDALRCACGSADLKVVAGRELRVLEVEVI